MKGTVVSFPQEAQMAEIIGGLQKGGTLDKDTANALKSPRGGFGEKSAAGI